MYTVYTPHHRKHATDNVWVRGVLFPNKEVPARAEVIRAAIEAARLGPLISPQDHGLTPVLAVHGHDYVAYLRTAYTQNATHTGTPEPVLVNRTALEPRRPAERPTTFSELRSYYTYDFEDPILDGTWKAAYWSAQCALSAADLVMGGERAAYALCRPPGHHAARDQYGGFCYLNNAAIAARRLSAEGRVAILDVDYHHGNGTQAIFYADPVVLYVSLHADPAQDYPFYWGFAGETGTGAGKGTNLNLPLPLGAGDASYLAALDVALATIQHFRPSVLIISLGMDAVAGDPIGKFALTPAGWAEVGRRTAALGLPTLLVQEGGYQLETLGTQAVNFLATFAPSR